MSEIWKWSASDIADAVRSKRVSAVEVTQAHLQRLAAVNPTINAVVQEFPKEALAEAQAVDGDNLSLHAAFIFELCSAKSIR